MKIITTMDEVPQKGRVFLNFSGSYCQPCKALAPHVDELERNHKEVTFLKVMAEDSMPVCRTYKVRSVPAIVLLHDGQVINFRVSPGMDTLEDFLQGE